MVKLEEDKFSSHINFRMAKKTYEELMMYLKKQEETLSRFMREATYNYLKIKQKFEGDKK